MEKDYDVSFFKPKSEFSKKNRDLVLTLVIIWAVSIFGFQILLKVIETAVPEQALIDFNSVKENVLNKNATDKEKQVFLKSLINVINKNTINKDTEKPVIINAINWSVYELVSDNNELSRRVVEINILKNQALNITDFTEYKVERFKIIEQQRNLVGDYFTELNINPSGIRAELLTSVLKDKESVNFNYEQEILLPQIMNKYLIHNRSVLTDTTFIGFPFHYFYTAVFLLILFVFLCYIYAWKIERLNKKFGIVE